MTIIDDGTGLGKEKMSKNRKLVIMAGIGLIFILIAIIVKQWGS